MKLMTCTKCGEEFELKPNKPGFANVCEDCSGLHEAAAPTPPKVKVGPVVKMKPRPVSPQTMRRHLRNVMKSMIELDQLMRGGR